MILQIVAIRDRAADAYQTPWFVHQLGQAIRAFSDETNRTGSELNKHPDDYDLWHLGNYDDHDGIFTNIPEGAKQIALGKNMITIK